MSKRGGKPYSKDDDPSEKLSSETRECKPWRVANTTFWGPTVLDAEDGVELPQLMGWSGGHDYVADRFSFMHEMAEDLSLPTPEGVKRSATFRGSLGNRQGETP